MPSAFISSRRSYPAVPLARQLVHQRSVHPGPLVLRTALFKSPAPATDRDRTVSRRSEPSSRATLIGEQPNPPLTYHRITNSYFRTCSTRRSRSQAGLCVCTLCTISVRAEPAFERLRYSFGGDRPSQTAHLTVSPGRIHGRRLENQQYKGGIPTSPPYKLTPVLLRLPPILYMHYRSSVLSYSKAPWGLSV